MPCSRRAGARGAHGWLNQTVGGWQTQAIYFAESGPALTFGNIIFNGNLHDIALPSSQRTLNEWFNVNAGFNTNSAQQLADNIRTFPLALSGVRAFGINNWDSSLFKNFPIREKLSFELRAEAQDATNHAQFAGPNTTPTSSAFGQVTSTTSNGGLQRVILLGGRLMW